MIFATLVLLTQNTHVDITDAAAGNMLNIFTQVKGAQAAKATEKAIAHRILLAQILLPL